MKLHPDECTVRDIGEGLWMLPSGQVCNEKQMKEITSTWKTVEIESDNQKEE